MSNIASGCHTSSAKPAPSIEARTTTTHKLNTKNRVPTIKICLMAAGLLAVATFVSVIKTLAAEPPTDPAHAAYIAAAAIQAGS